MRVIKTTLIGGAVFLVPVIVILFVLGKAISVMRHVTRPISEMLPFDNIARPGGRQPSRAAGCGTGLLLRRHAGPRPTGQAAV